jgi:serine/threonine protein kinase
VHAKAIVHGALKPSNIFIDNQGIVKVADFVIESEVKDALPQKALEVLHGAKYSSPEELEGIPSTPVSDLFSLGLILQEMAQGKMSQVKGGITGNYNKLRNPAYLGPDNLAGLPSYLSETIARSLQKDPLLRIASAAEFRLALEQKAPPAKPQDESDYRKIFETSVTQYGGEEIDRESETLQDVGRIRLRWSREKHRNWILSLVVGTSVLIGILYTFLFSR